MRIIAGKWKGHCLKSVNGMKTRPTSDKVKEAIFSILGPKVIDAHVLDLFAGTGSLSLEALSRGAQDTVLVEKHHAAWETISKNLVMLKAQDQSKLIKMDALAFLKQNIEEKYDLIFVDPPYHQGYVPKVMSYLRCELHLNPKGVIVVETGADEEIDKGLSPLEILIERKYGDTKLWFIQEKQE